jgi:hypothetical protein
MASGLSVKLPLSISEVFGPYNLNTTFTDLAKQNLKMLILTVPGERIMYPTFGVGLKQYLFEQNDVITYSDVEDRIREQVAIHLPYIRIDKIDFGIPESNPDMWPHDLSLSIFFTIVPLQQNTLLEIEVNN